MNEETMSFVFGVILLVFLASTPLMYSEKREVMRMQNNFVARMSIDEWDKAMAVTSDNFQWIKFDDYEAAKNVKSDEEAPAMTTYTAADWRTWISKMHDRTGVDFEIASMKKVTDRKYLVQTKFTIRYFNALRNWTLNWNAQCTWEQVGGTWRLTEIIETTKPTENTSN